jgi:DNA-binding CsgD family transcriptional regulator
MPVGMPARAATLPLLVVDGNWDEAHDLATVTRVQGSPLERQMAVTILGNLARYQGDTDLAWQMVRELLPRGPASEPEDALFPYAIETLRLAARLSLDASDIPGARDWLAAHDRWLEWSGAVRGRAEGRMLRARMFLVQDDLVEAEREAQAALRLACDPRQPLVQLETFHLLGTVSVKAEDYDSAERHLLNSLSLSDACAVPYERACVLVELADLHLRTGRADYAKGLLEQVTKTATELDAKPLLHAVKKLEARLDSRSTLSALTSRETDVLRLVAQGLTDAEVAEQLYISPRTVGQHLRSVYNKLGVSSRAAATRLAVEQNLI